MEEGAGRSWLRERFEESVLALKTEEDSREPRQAGRQL